MCAQLLGYGMSIKMFISFIEVVSKQTARAFGVPIIRLDDPQLKCQDNATITKAFSKEGEKDTNPENLFERPSRPESQLSMAGHTCANGPGNMTIPGAPAPWHYYFQQKVAEGLAVHLISAFSSPTEAFDLA